MTTPTRTRAGFTLIEVLIGVIILALGLLGLGALIPVVVREQRNAAEATLGVAAAAAAQSALTRGAAVDPASTGPTIWDFWRFNAQWGANGSDVSGVLLTGDRLWLFDTNSSLMQTANRRLYPTSATGIPTGLQQLSQGTYNYSISDAATGGMVWEVSDFQIPSLIVGAGAGRTYGTLGRQILRIPLADRLWPTPSQRTSESLVGTRDPYRPQFVWDFVARRMPPSRIPATASASDDLTASELPVISVGESMQVVVFVRRVDQNIRVPAGINSVTNENYKLYDLLTWRLPSGGADVNRRVPVAVDVDGLPTNAGFDPRNQSNAPIYSPIVSVRAQVDPANNGERDVILLQAQSHFATGLSQAQLTKLLRLAAVPGQKLVDNLGNVYTVQGIATPSLIDEPQIEVKVSPAVQASILRTDVPGSPLSSDPNNPNVLRQIVFTPQIPAAVRVFTVTRPVLTP